MAATEYRNCQEKSIDLHRQFLACVRVYTQHVTFLVTPVIAQDKPYSPYKTRTKNGPRTILVHLCTGTVFQQIKLFLSQGVFK